MIAWYWVLVTSWVTVGCVLTVGYDEVDGEKKPLDYFILLAIGPLILAGAIWEGRGK